MDAARWERLNELFHGAVGRDPEARAAWLDRTCAQDPTLRAEVERLVRAHERASGFIGSGDSPMAVRWLARTGRLAAPPSFPGTRRFTVRRTLGVGGMGVVYEVHDRDRDEVVALKTLLAAQPAEAYRLKREFRALADVAHVNLVSLYELFVEDGHCFFTMELVGGLNFVDAVRTRPVEAALDVRCLLELLEQLVHGVSELHRHRKLHRDIKPSNVLVTPPGRLVILDFGLIAEMSVAAACRDDGIAGTPAYMSPEQALGAPASEASDWYGVGATLFEALTGRPPFSGSLSEVFRLKTESEAPDPAEVADGVPADLGAVCAGLLHRDPSRRLTGEAALHRLGRGRGAVSPPAGGGQDAPFVGRRWQLEVLHESLASTRDGRPAGVYVCGPSGIGKSALVRSFLGQLPAGNPALVLAGRCYENESVPFKALDGVVDSLSHYLASLPSAAAQELVPAAASALARVFPVLLRVEAVRSLAPDEDGDAVRIRRRAFGAARELLARMAAVQPVVIFIDDLHWADADSAVLLEDLLLRPDSPAVLTVACFRTEEMAAKPFLRTLLAGGRTITPLPLAPMTDEEARELIAVVMPADRPVNAEDVSRIAREAEGNPFFLEQITRHAALHRSGRAEEPTLGEMLDRRLSALPEGARDFLETLALCGRPMAPPLVGQAAGLAGDQRSMTALLRSANFVRSSGSGERIEVYHDRIRETLVAQLDAGRRARRHLRVAEALVARGVDDPEALFEHYRAGGDRAQAAVFALEAARKAGETLAFDRAALFYRHALELAPGRQPEWKAGLAQALSNAGRPAEAARAFLEAADDAQAPVRLDLQRSAANQFLIGGHIDDGVAVMRKVLQAVGMRFPATMPAALASLAWQRARLRWRGWRFTERDAKEVPPDQLLRIDICWSVMIGISMVDNLRGWDFHTRHALLALDAGEPYRIARALAAEAPFAVLRHSAAGQRATGFAEQATELAERIAHPHAIALATMMAGLVAEFRGQWTEGSRLFERALALLRDKCVGVTWELSVSHGFFLGSLLYQGRFREVVRRLPAVLAAARDHGNLYLEAELRTRQMSLLLLAADDPGEADRQSREVMERWWHGGFTRQHYNDVLGRTITALYRGDAAGAWRIVAESRPLIRRKGLLIVQVMRVEVAFLRGRCALAMAAGGGPRRFLQVARREARRLARERVLWADGFSALLSAGVACLQGAGREAERRLEDAIDALHRADMNLYAAGARRRLGVLQGERGAALLRQADEWMAAQDIRNPRFMTRMIAPGFPDV
jgi:serine/threonine protein kinase